MITTILFDLDDKLLDFTKAEAIALRRALEEAGLPAGKDVLDRYHVINRRQWELLEEGLLTREQVLVRRFQLLFEELGVKADPKAVCEQYETYLAQGHWFVPGAPELLRVLAPRYELYLASNGASFVQRRRLESAGITGYFQGIFLSEEVGADKPQRAFFETCFASIPHFQKETALMVGDSLTSDIRGGKNAGIRTCWFAPQGQPARPDIRPDYRICALEELPALLETL